MPLQSRINRVYKSVANWVHEISVVRDCPGFIETEMTGELNEDKLKDLLDESVSVETNWQR
jgi:3-hydroxyacyl-CoA dehydrogenase